MHEANPLAFPSEHTVSLLLPRATVRLETYAMLSRRGTNNRWWEGPHCGAPLAILEVIYRR